MSSSTEILRYIDSIAREKEIDKDHLIESIEQQITLAMSKRYDLEDLELRLDRDTGEWVCNYDIDMEKEGRILAQVVKQGFIGKVREAERDRLYDEYEQRIGEIINGTVQRFEGDAMILNIGRNIEAILPRSERVRSENYQVGDRIRAMVLEVKKFGTRLKIIMSRAHRDLVRCLFELEVPEIADGTIMIRRIEREPGYRTKLAVHSNDLKVDCVGACVGVRGTRIKSIIDELNGERIDIIRWNDDPEILIVNALKPAEISHIELDHQGRKALVLVEEDQQSLAIGRKGQNVRLASKLSGWEIDIMTRAELEKTVAEEESATEEGTEATPAAEGSPASNGAEDEAPAADADVQAPQERNETGGDVAAGENGMTPATAGDAGDPDSAPRTDDGAADEVPSPGPTGEAGAVGDEGAERDPERN